MYIHIGNDYILRRDDIIGVFDMDNSTSSHITREFLSRAESRGGVINTAEDIPKSYIVTSDGEVFLSQLMTQTILRRNESPGIE